MRKLRVCCSVVKEKSLDARAKGGKADGRVVTHEDFNKMLDEYYKLRRWDKEGHPTKEKTERTRLHIEYVEVHHTINFKARLFDRLISGYC